MYTPRATPRLAVPIALGIAVAVALGALAAPASATAVAGGGAAPSSVTFGTNASLSSYGNVTSTVVGDGGHCNGTVTYGFVQNLSQTNTSTSTAYFALQETFGISVSVVCSGPVKITSIVYHGWETYDAYANLTDTASVLASMSNGGSPITANVTAIGLENSSTRTVAGVWESIQDTYLGNHSVERSVSAGANYSSDSSVAFSPALGILPVGNLTPGESWTSTAAYAAAGGWAANWTLLVSGPLGQSSFPGSSERNYTASGVLVLTGAAGPSEFPQVHSERLAPVTYAFSDSQFSLFGGLIVGFTLGSQPNPFQGNFAAEFQSQTGAVNTAQLGEIYVTPSVVAGGNPLRELASRLDAPTVNFSSQLTDPDNSNANNNVSKNVQGNALTPTQASADSACLQASTCATSTGGSNPATLHGLLEITVVIGAVLAIAAVAVVLVAGRQRSIPPPKYPNANLYPPGSATAAAPPASASGSEKAGTDESPAEDPLRQLW